MRRNRCTVPLARPSTLGFDVNVAGASIGAPASYSGKDSFGNVPGAKRASHAVPDLEAYHGQDIVLTEALTREAKVRVAEAVDAVQPFFLCFAHYEGGMRVPFVAAWARPDAESPHQQRLPIAAGTISPAIASVTDLFPTLLGLAGAEVRANHPVDGKPLDALLAGQPDSALGSPSAIIIAIDHGQFQLSPRKRGHDPVDRSRLQVTKSLLATLSG